MKKLILLGILFGLATTIALFTGCNSSGTNQVLGDPNDPEFQLIDDIVADAALENVGKIIDISFMFYDSIPGVSPSGKFNVDKQSQSDEFIAVDSFNYVYANGWHSFDFWIKVIDTISFDTVVVTGSDSLRTLSNNVPMQVPDSTVDEINIRCHYTFDLVSGTFTGSADYSLDMTNITSDLLTPVTINASGSETLNGLEADSQVTCDFNLSNSLSASDVVAQLEGGSGCPTSGSINLTANVDISCNGQIGSSIDTVNIQGEWDIAAVFNNGNVDVSYTDGTTVWEATVPCDQPVTSPISRWIPHID